MSFRSIEEHHRDRESGGHCIEAGGGPHYFAYIDPTQDGRICIDCGAPEEVSE